MSKTKQPEKSLPELIADVHAKANAYIDSKVAEIKKTMPGVPEVTIRHGFERRGACPCQQALAAWEQQ